MNKAFEVVVGFTAIDALTGPMEKMAAQMGLTGKLAEETQKKLNGFRNLGFVGAGLTAFGLGIAAGLKTAIDEAGKLQMSLMGVKESLGLTADEFQKAMNMSQTAGIPTIFSAQDVGGIMQAMATSGLTKDMVLNPDVLQQYVNFADVQAQIKKEAAPELVSAAVNMAHQFQLYTSDQISPFLETLNGALLHTHQTAQEFATQYQYIAPQAKMMGIGSEETLDITAWLSRMGFGNGRGGTNFSDFLRRSIYGSSGKKADQAMQTAGFVADGHSVFEDENGNFVGIMKASQILQDFNSRFGGDANVTSPLLHDIFGTQGARIAQMLMMPGASEQYQAVQKQIGGTAPISQSQKEMNETWEGQLKQAKSTGTDVLQAFGVAAMPSLIAVLHIVNSILSTILEFEQAHPTIMKIVAAFFELVAAVALVLGPIMVLAGIIGYFKTAGIIGTGLRVMASAFGTLFAPVQALFALLVANPIVAIIVAIIAALAILYTAWTNNWGGIQDKVHSFGNSISSAWSSLTGKVASVWNGIINTIKSGWNSATSFIANNWRTIVAGILILMGPIGWAILAVAHVITSNWQAISTFFSTLWHTIYTNAISIWNAIGSGLSLIWNTIVAIAQSIWEPVASFLSSVWEQIKETAITVWDSITTAIEGAWDKLVSYISEKVGWIKSIIGGIGDAVSGALLSFSGLAQNAGQYAFGVPSVAPGIAQNASGTNFFGGGLTWVGESGKELLNLPRGSQIIPHHQLGDMGGPVTNNITIYPTPNQSPSDIAEEVIRRIGRSMRDQSLSRGSTIDPAW